MPPTGRRDNKLTAKRNQGCIPKKEVGTRTPETRLKQRFFKRFRSTYTYTYTRQKNCHSGSLVLSCDTATEIILHCVSVSNQLQQWTNFCTNFSPKSGGSGDASPLSKKWGTPPPCFPAPLHPWQCNYHNYVGRRLVVTILSGGQRERAS